MLWFVWVNTLIQARPSTVLPTWLYIVGCAMVMLSTDPLPERRSEKVVAIFAWPIMFPYTLRRMAPVTTTRLPARSWFHA